MHQKRTKKLFLLTTWRMALFTKRTFFLFLSECHLSRKERHLYFLPCQMHLKRTTKLFLLTTWRMALTTKRTFFFCSFLKVIFVEKNVICTFCLAKCIRKGQKKMFLLTTWRMALSTKRAFFCSFLNVISLEKNVTCTFCLAKCIRKGQKIVPFDYMKNGSLHKKNFLFLSECHLSRKERFTFFAKCIRKGPQKKILLTTWRMSSLKRTSFVLFALPNASEKCKNLYFLPFDYMKNGSHHKKNIFFVPFWRSSL